MTEPVCACGRCSFHPEQYDELVKRRQAYANRPIEDRVRAYDDEGTVIPVLGWVEVLDAIERSVRGEVSGD